MAKEGYFEEWQKDFSKKLDDLLSMNHGFDISESTTRSVMTMIEAEKKKSFMRGYDLGYKQGRSDAEGQG